MSQKKNVTEEFIIFDKVKWYKDENQNTIKEWLDFLLKSLSDNNLLSEEGKKIFLEFGIDDEFSLNSDLLTAEGVAFLKTRYKKFVLNLSKKGISSATKELTNELILFSIKVPKEKGFLYACVETSWDIAKEEGFSYEQATNKFKALLQWASDNGHLEDEAKKYLLLDTLPRKFCLYSWMFSKEFDKKIPPIYTEWSKKIKFNSPNIDMSLIEESLK